VTGLLLPLVLAAVLSVVAVRAARSGAPPRPPRVRLPRRALAAAGILAATAAGLVALAGHGAPSGVAAARQCSPAASATRCR
jgi:hypothetical protein